MTEPRERRVIRKGSVGEDDLDDRLSAADAGAAPGDDGLAPDDDGPNGEDDSDDAGEDSDDRDDDDADARRAPDDDDAPSHARNPIEPRPARRMPTAAILFVGAATLWMGAMAIRCRPPEVPTAAVPTGDSADVAKDAAPDDGPTPAGPLPDAEPEDGPTPMADRQPDGPGTADEPAPQDDAPPAGDRLPVRRADWTVGLEPPTKVRYTIRRGGSLENVANLFKIFHHEILALNPGIAIDQELPSNSRVVIYDRPKGEQSASVGFPSAGSLSGAVPMVEGAGRRILAIGWKTWATDTSVAILDRVLDQWAKRGASVQPILVGNLSNRTGGRLEPHSTHQSGRDVDLGYPQKLAPGAELGWQEMNEVNLEPAETWALLFLLGDCGAVEGIYMDRSIQKLLHDYALRTELLSKAALAKWMEYPGPSGGGGLISHVAGHTDHMHVRWSCAAQDHRCTSR